jgi:hypothetical protein
MPRYKVITPKDDEDVPVVLPDSLGLHQAEYDAYRDAILKAIAEVDGRTGANPFYVGEIVLYSYGEGIVHLDWWGEFQGYSEELLVG